MLDNGTFADPQNDRNTTSHKTNQHPIKNFQVSSEIQFRASDMAVSPSVTEHLNYEAGEM